MDMILIRDVFKMLEGKIASECAISVVYKCHLCYTSVNKINIS